MDYMQLAGVALDEYLMAELIGSGGMSAVYRAYQEELDRHVAIKVLSSQLAEDTQYITRFNQEAKMAASLEHPHIVPVYDFGIHNNMMYVVMRLLTGGTLYDKLDGAMNKNEAMHTLSSITQALDYAHARHIVHRDVKPGNIMYDEQGTPYLVDFGIAKATEQNLDLTSENVVLGTPMYMPPEQWRGDQPIPATDQYALSVIAYRMLTGVPAFAGVSSQNLMYQHLNETATLAHQVNPNLPTEVSVVLAKGMAKNPGDRYPRISNFANALGQAIQQPVAIETQEHQAVETVVNLPGPHEAKPPPVEQLHYAPPAPPSQLLPQPIQVQSSRSSTTSFIGGSMIGLVLLVILVIGGGFVLLQVTNNNNEPASVIDVTVTNDKDTIANIPTLTSLPNPDIDIIGLSNFPLSQRSIINNEPVIPVRDAVYSPDGTIIASAHGDGTIRFWKNGNVTAYPAHTDVASKVAFSPDGQWLASIGRDNNLKIWRVSDETNTQTLAGHTAALRDVVFSPDGLRLATVAEDRTIRIWRTSDWSLETTLTGHEEAVLSVAFSPDSTLLASVGRENRVYIWDMTALRFNRYLDGHSESVRDVDFSPDGQKLVSSSTDDSIKIWDLGSGRVLHTLTGHGRDVWTVIFSPDSALIASGGRDNNLRIWDVSTGAQLDNITSHAGWVLGVDFAPDGSTLVSASGDGTIRIWE